MLPGKITPDWTINQGKYFTVDRSKLPNKLPYFLRLCRNLARIKAHLAKLLGVPLLTNLTQANVGLNGACKHG